MSADEAVEGLNAPHQSAESDRKGALGFWDGWSQPSCIRLTSGCAFCHEDNIARFLMVRCILEARVFSRFRR